MPGENREQGEGWSEPNWFAVQAKPHRENLAAASLSTLDLEVFLPRIKQEQMVCGIERVLVKPLFRGYLFARFAPGPLLDSVRYARGVLRVVGPGSWPHPVEDEIIAAIKDREQADGFIRLAPNVFHPGDRVVVGQGSLAGWMGRVEREWDDGKRVMILLEAVLSPRLLIDKRCLTLVENAA